MPTYQYACTDPECANRFELVQAFTDPAVTSCPVCTSPVRKVYGSVGVVFKGSGFYRNDSRSEAGGKSKGSGNESAAGAKDGANSSAKEAASSAKGDSAGATGSSSGSSGSSTSSTQAASSASSTQSGKAAASA